MTLSYDIVTVVSKIYRYNNVFTFVDRIYDINCMCILLLH